MRISRGLVVIGVVFVIVLGILFACVYSWRSSQLDQDDMTAEQVEEIDQNKIEDITVIIGDKEYTNIEEISGVVAGTTVNCVVKTVAGEEKMVNGYIVMGSDYHYEWSGDGIVKITIKK